MSRKSRRNRGLNRTAQQASALPKPETNASVPRSGGQLIATAQNDITIPFYSDILVPQDPTIKEKGPHKGLKLYDEVMQDGRAKATLSKRYSKITRREWLVKAASEDDRDVKAKEGIEAILDALPFDAICKDLAKAILKGVAISEIVWGRNEDGLVVPVQIKSHDPMRFAFDKDWNPRLLTPSNSIEGEAVPKRKFITHRFGAEGNNPYGLGLGSVLFWHVLFKREGVGFWMKFLDKFAAPIPFGKFAVGTPDNEQKKLLNSLIAMVQQGALVAPIGTEVSFLEAARSGNASYEEWCRFWDEQTSEVVLGSTLSTSVKGQGSRAAAQTHADETDSIVDDDCDQLSDTLNETLLRWITELNWPGAKPPTVWRPRPRNESEEEDQKKKTAERRQSDIRSLDAARRQGFEPKNLQEWLSSVFDAEMIPVEVTASMDDQQSAFADDAEGPVAHLIDPLEDLAGPQQQTWFERIRERLAGVASFGEASKVLLDLSGQLEIDPMGRILGDAIALSEITGRSDIIDETGGYPSKDVGSKKKDQNPVSFAEVGPFDEALDFHRQKVRLSTRTWSDLLHHGHDRAFVVAGAQKDALLEDFQQAIDDAIAKGMPLKGWLDKDDSYHPGFIDRFDEIVKRHGWDYNGGSNWRARVIYETNLKTAYAAGRYKQMTDPATLKAFPYWQYKHAWERIPLHPREEHEAWDGLILRADDPWWQTYYPPNGWKCGCGVRPVSRAKLKRIGKETPDTAPSIQHVRRSDPGTGEEIDYPAGVDMGWAYAPGRTWADGTIPRELQRSNPKQLTLPHIDPLPQMSAIARPVQAEVLPKGLDDADYVSAFLSEFGADESEPVLFRDKAGQVLVIGEELFKRRDGSIKLNSSRSVQLLRLAEALKDPDEIWVDWEWHSHLKKWVLKRRYLRASPNLAGLSVFEWGKDGWSGTTIYNAETGRKRKPNLNQINTWRRGALLFRRAISADEN